MTTGGVETALLCDDCGADRSGDGRAHHGAPCPVCGGTLRRYIGPPDDAADVLAGAVEQLELLADDRDPTTEGRALHEHLRGLLDAHT